MKDLYPRIVSQELKRKANVTSRVSMKDRLRREIMESRRLEEEAALLEPEETEEVHGCI